MTVNHGVLGSSPRGGAKASEQSEAFYIIPEGSLAQLVRVPHVRD
jgi:hypothetical protein